MRKSKLKRKTIICETCGNTEQIEYYESQKHRTFRYCSPQCSMAGAFKIRKPQMSTNNPSSDPQVRAKISASMKEKHSLGKKTKRGGNGHGITECEKILLGVFPDLVPNYIQSLGKRTPGYPTHYKIDLADPEHKIAIEVDGNSHDSLKRQAQDRKKEEKLSALGWEVLRVTNKAVKENLQEVAEWLRLSLDR